MEPQIPNKFSNPTSLTHENDPRVSPKKVTHEFDPQERPTSLTHENCPQNPCDPHDLAHSLPLASQTFRS